MDGKIGAASVALGSFAILAPPVIDWLFPSIPADVRAALHQVGQIVSVAALGGAWLGQSPISKKS